MLRAGDMAGANTRLAIKYAQGIHTRTGKKVAILYPDVPELERAVEQSGSNTPQPGVVCYIRCERRSARRRRPNRRSSRCSARARRWCAKCPDADVYVGLTFRRRSYRMPKN